MTGYTIVGGNMGNYHEHTGGHQKETHVKPVVDHFLCNHCGSGEKTKKVVVYNMANILCFSCRSRMQDEIIDIAKRYLIVSV